MRQLRVSGSSLGLPKRIRITYKKEKEERIEPPEWIDTDEDDIEKLDNRNRTKAQMLPGKSLSPPCNTLDSTIPGASSSMTGYFGLVRREAAEEPEELHRCLCCLITKVDPVVVKNDDPRLELLAKAALTTGMFARLCIRFGIFPFWEAETVELYYKKKAEVEKKTRHEKECQLAEMFAREKWIERQILVNEVKLEQLLYGEKQVPISQLRSRRNKLNILRASRNSNRQQMIALRLAPMDSVWAGLVAEQDVLQYILMEG